MVLDNESYYLEHWEREYYQRVLSKRYPNKEIKLMTDIELMNLWDESEDYET